MGGKNREKTLYGWVRYMVGYHKKEARENCGSATIIFKIVKSDSIRLFNDFIIIYIFNISCGGVCDDRQCQGVQCFLQLTKVEATYG